MYHFRQMSLELDTYLWKCKHMHKYRDVGNTEIQYTHTVSCHANANNLTLYSLRVIVLKSPNQWIKCLYVCSHRRCVAGFCFVVGTSLTKLRPKEVYTLYLYGVIRISASLLLFCSKNLIFTKVNFVHDIWIMPSPPIFTSPPHPNRHIILLYSNRI